MPGLRGVGLGSAEKVVVLHVAGQVGLGDVLEQGRGLRNRSDGVGEAGNIAGALGVGGDGSVFVERAGIAHAGKSEEYGVFAAGLEEPGDVRRAHERDAKAIGAGRRLLLGLTAQAEGLSVEGGVAAGPEEGAVGLVGIEAAEVASTAATAATAKTSAAEASPAAESETVSAEASAEEAAATGKIPSAGPGSGRASGALAAVLGAHGLNEVAHAIHIDAGERADGSALSSDRDRITAEVGIAGDGRKRRAACTRSAGRSGLRIASERAHQAQALRAVSGELADGLLNLRGLAFLLRLLRGCPGGQDQVEIHRLIMIRRIEQRLLRAGGEGCKLGANDVAPVLRNGHGPGAGDVGSGGKPLAG